MITTCTLFQSAMKITEAVLTIALTQGQVTAVAVRRASNLQLMRGTVTVRIILCHMVCRNISLFSEKKAETGEIWKQFASLSLRTVFVGC